MKLFTHLSTTQRQLFWTLLTTVLLLGMWAAVAHAQSRDSSRRDEGLSARQDEHERRLKQDDEDIRKIQDTLNEHDKQLAEIRGIAIGFGSITTVMQLVMLLVHWTKSNQMLRVVSSRSDDESAVHRFTLARHHRRNEEDVTNGG